MRRLSVILFTRLALVLGLQPAYAAPTDIRITESGTGEVVSCSASNPDACEWRYVGTGNGSPFNRQVYVVVEIQTASSWDANGCQEISSGEVHFFRNANLRSSIGWMKRLSGSFCKLGGGTTGHFMTVAFTVEPESRPGPYRSAVGSGVMSFVDSVGDTPGATGFWSADEDGFMDF